jgi:predicted transglutaminase-like cysteine proteinase
VSRSFLSQFAAIAVVMCSVEAATAQSLTDNRRDAAKPISTAAISPNAGALFDVEIDLPKAKLGVFQSVAISAQRLPVAEKWQEVRSQDHAAFFSYDCAALGFSGCDTEFSQSLRDVVTQAHGLSTLDQLAEVNTAVNDAITYRDDSTVWQQLDYWATPSEIAELAWGDCEDYAITKYWMLKELGFDESQLQIVVLQDTRRRLFHAVLVVHTEHGAYVLDSTSDRLELDTDYAGYLPLMSFAGSKNYIHGFMGGSVSVASTPKDFGAIAPGASF